MSAFWPKDTSFVITVTSASKRTETLETLHTVSNQLSIYGNTRDILSAYTETLEVYCLLAYMETLETYVHTVSNQHIWKQSRHTLMQYLLHWKGIWPKARNFEKNAD